MTNIIIEPHPLTVNNSVINALTIKQWEKEMNPAERQLEYFESDDFAGNYLHVMHEMFCNEEHEIKKRIRDIYYYEYDIELSAEQKDAIYQHTLDNFDGYVEMFTSYYTGHYSLDSIAFGEQEVQLTGLYNHRNKKEYSLPYLKGVFDDAGFYVGDDCAYYDLSAAGLHIRVSPEQMAGILGADSETGEIA